MFDIDFNKKNPFTLLNSICFLAIQIKKCAPGLNRSLPSNLLWRRSANHLKFKEECVM